MGWRGEDASRCGEAADGERDREASRRRRGGPSARANSDTEAKPACERRGSDEQGGRRENRLMREREAEPKSQLRHGDMPACERRGPGEQGECRENRRKRVRKRGWPSLRANSDTEAKPACKWRGRDEHGERRENRRERVRKRGWVAAEAAGRWQRRMGMRRTGWRVGCVQWQSGVWLQR